MNTKLKGLILGALASASYGLNPTFTLPLYADGMSTDSVLLLRYGIAIPVVALIMKVRHCPFKQSKKDIPLLAILGVLMALSSLTLYLSYNYMAAGIASTILFVYPVMVAVIMAMFYKERVTVMTVVCLALATAGILLLYRTSDSSGLTSSHETLSLAGTLLVIVSAIVYAVYIVGVRKWRVSGIDPISLTFYVLCFGVVVFIVSLLLHGGFSLPGKWYLWVDVLALSVIPTAMSLVFTAQAIKLIGPTPTAILGALEPVTAVVMGILLFGEPFSLREATGIFLILLAVCLIIVFRRK